VDFDEKGNPAGPNAGGFKRSINTYVCHFMPINFKQIGDVPVEDYKAVLNVLTVSIFSSTGWSIPLIKYTVHFVHSALLSTAYILERERRIGFSIYICISLPA
jgi:hypothetical protein